MYNQFDLQDFLNYDSNTEEFLSYTERLSLHRQIARGINGLSLLDFTPKLEEKLKEVKCEMKRTKWKSLTCRYDQNRELIEVK